MWKIKLYFYNHSVILGYFISAFTVDFKVGTEVKVKVLKVKNRMEPYERIVHK